MSSSSEESSGEEEEEHEESSPRPKWVRGDAEFSDFAFHPSLCKLAAADMDGYLSIYNLSPGEFPDEIFDKRLCKKPCRSIAHTVDGNGIFIAGKVGSLRLFDLESEKISQVLMKKESPSYCISVINQNLIACGDDYGTMKLWDLRKGATPIMEEDRSHDFISSISVDRNGKFLFCTSGDGTMSTFNVKRRKFIVQSENAEYDMTCVSVVKDNKKVVVGTSEGLMLLYNWEEFAAPSDRFPGHPTPIECLVPISDDVVCTGSMDGMIRAVHLLPNRFLGIVGEHREMPVSKVAVSPDRKFIASSAHDSIIKFWNVDHLHRTSVKANAKPQRGLKTKKHVKSGVSDDKQSFISDLDKDLMVPVVKESSSEDDTDDDMSEEDTNENLNNENVS